jgi:hypothetical protein
MKLATSLVPVKKISSPVDGSTFDDNALNTTANLILKVEGIINPLIVRRTSLESYQVVEGHFEYYAAVKAREIDARKGEMIGAFIIESDNEEFLIEQAKILRKKEALATGEQDIHLMLKQFERLPNQVENLTVMLNQVAESVKKIAEVVAQPSEAISVSNNSNTISSAAYNKMTKPELIKIASERNLKVNSKMKKDDIIAAIKKAELD